MKMVISKAVLYRALLLGFVSFMFFIPKESYSQYYVSEVSSIKKWSQIENKDFKIVFPTVNPYTGLTVATYMNALNPVITRGLQNPLQKFPVLIHTENILSNGMVTFTPKRMELYSVPSRNTFATQWLKQLVAHEYRHVAQLSNLNIGITKAAYYVFGEQAPGVVTAVLPYYFMEGDAVLTETLFSTFGRGRQPNFTVEYRALLENYDVLFRNNNPDKLNVNKMLLGSMKDNVPSIYSSGYLMVGAASRYYGGDFWGNLVEYTGKYPFTIIPSTFAFKKYAKEDFETLAKRTFVELKEHWDKYSMVEDSAIKIDSKKTSYTTYTSPLPFNDSLIVTLKVDMDKTSRFVILNKKTKKEYRLLYTGYVTSRPIIKDDTIYWTEYRPSISWGQKNSSIVKSAKLEFNKNGKVKAELHKDKKVTEQGVFYVTAMGSDGFAMISYDEQNTPELIVTDQKFNITQRYLCRWFDASFNGLAWDNKTKQIVGIILNEDGMWLGAFNNKTEKFDKLKKASYVTINNLSANDGRIFFTSISSGKDEVHTMDLTTRREHQITESKFGAIASSFGSLWSQRTANDSTILLTTYSLEGYSIATQKVDEKNAKKIEYQFIPKDFLSLKYDSISQLRIQEYPIINLDTVKMDSAAMQSYEVKKYRKGLNAFNIHSWAPVFLNLKRMMNERELAVGGGALFLSQNLLSNTIVGATVGYYKKMFATNIMATYTGLPVHISTNIDYGGGYQNVQSSVSNIKNIAGATKNSRDKYLAVEAGLSLPLNLSSGVNNRFFNISADYSYINTVLENESGIEKGVHKLAFSAAFSNYMSRSAKAIGPPLGYAVELYTSINPVIMNFGTIYGVYAKGFFPGIIKNHSFQLSSLYQYQDSGEFNFMQKGLFPLGAYSDFTAKMLFSSKASYQAPIFYPDWGIGSIIYFKRISARFIGEYAHSEPTDNYKDIIHTRNFYTYGGGLDFDINIFRMSTIPLTVGFMIYKTNTNKSVGMTYNIILNF